MTAAHGGCLPVEGAPSPRQQRGWSLADAITDAGFAAGWRLVRAVPEPVARAAFRAGADAAARRGGPGARRLRANLRRVVPDAAPAELDALVRAGLRSYARYWCEAFRLPTMDRADVLGRMDPHAAGMAPLFEALNEGRGVVAALPHSGNWDLAGLWFVETQRRLGRPQRFTTVVERLRPESLFRRFVAYRESLGFEVLAAGDGPGVYRTLLRRLRDGGLVCLVADRDLTASGVEVSFFGEPARLPAGPARLAARTGAMLLPAFPSFTRDGWAATVGPPVPVAGGAGRDDLVKATQELADALAALIATAPQDWHMLQPVFVADLGRKP
jgi:KDO2-lipid IV(A) lauroyltransferase